MTGGEEVITTKEEVPKSKLFCTTVLFLVGGAGESVPSALTLLSPWFIIWTSMELVQQLQVVDICLTAKAQPLALV